MLTLVAQRTPTTTRFATFAQPQAPSAAQNPADEKPSPWAAFVTALLQAFSTPCF